MPHVPNLWLFATGTGIGPFLSILNTTDPWKRFKKLILCYSVKTSDNMAYHANFEKLLSLYPDQFNFVPLITQEVVQGTVNSRITTYLENGELEESVGLRLHGQTIN